MNSEFAEPAPITLLRLEGSPREMGLMHGEIAKEKIHTLADVRIDLIKRINGIRSTGDIELVATAMAGYIEANMPSVYSETYATSVAANLDYWRLIVAGAFSDVIDLVARRTGRQPEPHNECTLITLNTKESGQILIGSWDSHATATDALVLCLRKPIGFNHTIALSTAGWPMQQGITSGGYGFAIANLVSRSSSSIGVPYIAVLPYVAQATDTVTAVDRIKEIPHVSARMYAFCDEKSAQMIEVAPRLGIRLQSTSSAAHTNHFIYCADYEGRPENPSSQGRLNIANKLIQKLKFDATVDEIVDGFVRSGVIQTGMGDSDRTGVVFVLIPQAREIRYLCGPELFSFDTLSMNRIGF